MAHVEQACRSTKYHSHSAAAQMSGAQPRRECLAVHARQLAVEPCIQILYRYPRSLLLRMEQPHRSAMVHHVTRSARLGAPVSIIESWYKAALVCNPACERVLLRHAWKADYQWALKAAIKVVEKTKKKTRKIIR